MESQTDQIIAKISKGSKMDQVYLPKNRNGMLPGEYVIINTLISPIPKIKEEKKEFKPYFYGLQKIKIEPVKMQIIKEIFNLSKKFIKEESNILITGSFIDRGFNFNDIDLLIISNKLNLKNLEEEIIKKIGIKPHILSLNKEEFIKGLSSDPLYQTMISRCISKNRLIFNFKPIINAKLLDLNLLKSKTLIDNFNILNGKEKYYLTFNLISISLFLEHKRITKELVEKTIKERFNIKTLEEIKNNLLKKDFLEKYKEVYNKTFNQIMKEIKNESK